MRILLTNDDGITATGLNVLAAELESRGHDVFAVAPDTERSASSHSITIHKPICVEQTGDRRWAVSGTPVDCIFLALEVLVGKEIDLVISGINSGQNMGEDILYSGTVAAAIEAMFLGCKALAVSIRDYTDQHFETAAKLTADMLDSGIQDFADSTRILNLNFPNLPVEQVKGVKLTRIGHRKYRNFVRENESTESGRVFLVGGDIAYWREEPGTDYHEVAQGYISITPLYPNFDTALVQNLGGWIESHPIREQEALR